MGKMNSVRKKAMPRTLPSSARANAMPKTISAITQTAANIRVVVSDRHTAASRKAATKASIPIHLASLQGVPMLQS